jgi:hypothetical protein
MKAAMPVLSNSKREQFALAIAKGVSATKAYISVGYSECGAKQSAARLLRNAEVSSRVAQLQVELSAGTIALEISSRNARVQALQKRWDCLRAGVDLLLQQRGAGMADVPGGASGLLFRDSRGVARVDSGLVSLLAELRAHEQQAAQELSQWQTRSAVEEPKVIDVTPAAMTLAMVMTSAELEELERRMLELERGRESHEITLESEGAFMDSSTPNTKAVESPKRTITVSAVSNQGEQPTNPTRLRSGELDPETVMSHYQSP